MLVRRNVKNNYSLLCCQIQFFSSKKETRSASCQCLISSGFAQKKSCIKSFNSFHFSTSVPFPYQIRQKNSGTKISAIEHVEYINRESIFAHDELWNQSNKFVNNFITIAIALILADGLVQHNRGGCIFQSHHLLKGAIIDPFITKHWMMSDEQHHPNVHIIFNSARVEARGSVNFFQDTALHYLFRKNCPRTFL